MYDFQIKVVKPLSYFGDFRRIGKFRYMSFMNPSVDIILNNKLEVFRPIRIMCIFGVFQKPREVFSSKKFRDFVAKSFFKPLIYKISVPILPRSLTIFFL